MEKLSLSSQKARLSLAIFPGERTLSSGRLDFALQDDLKSCRFMFADGSKVTTPLEIAILKML